MVGKNVLIHRARRLSSNLFNKKQKNMLLDLTDEGCVQIDRSYILP